MTKSRMTKMNDEARMTTSSHSDFVIRASSFTRHVLRHPRPSRPGGVRRRSRRGDRAGARRPALTMILCPAVSADSSRAVVRLAERVRSAGRRRHPSQLDRTRPCRAIGSRSSRWPASPASWPSARRGSTAIGTSPRSRFSRNTSTAICGCRKQRDLPVILHCRDAQADLLPMLRAAAARGRPRRGSRLQRRRGLRRRMPGLGLYVSFAGNVTYSNKKFEPLRAAARTIPADRLLVETDSPYLVPQSFRGKQKRNEPAHVRPHGGVSGRAARRAARATCRRNHGQRPAAVPIAGAAGMK